MLICPPNKSLILIEKKREEKRVEVVIILDRMQPQRNKRAKVVVQMVSSQAVKSSSSLRAVSSVRRTRVSSWGGNAWSGWSPQSNSTTSFTSPGRSGRFTSREANQVYAPHQQHSVQSLCTRRLAVLLHALTMFGTEEKQGHRQVYRAYLPRNHQEGLT